MDINTLRGLSTLFLLFAFLGLVIWAYSGKRKKEFEEAAGLPFADDDLSKSSSHGRSEHKGEDHE